MAEQKSGRDEARAKDTESANPSGAPGAPGATGEQPLPGSTTGTIGGGGPEAGAPVPRGKVPDEPPARPENAASGRLEPDPLAVTQPPDATTTRRGDTQAH